MLAHVTLFSINELMQKLHTPNKLHRSCDDYFINKMQSAPGVGIIYKKKRKILFNLISDLFKCVCNNYALFAVDCTDRLKIDGQPCSLEAHIVAQLIFFFMSQAYSRIFYAI